MAQFTTSKDIDENSAEDEDKSSSKSQVAIEISDKTNSNTTDTETTAGIVTLQKKAAALRAEAASIETKLRASQLAKRQKKIDDIDRWIAECLYVTVLPVQRKSLPSDSTSDDDDDSDDDDGMITTAAPVEWLNSVETAAQILRDERYSHEQVSKMFDRICDTSPAQSRSNCSPLMALLVDAAGKLDCVERDENPNKRWDGRVERDLRQKLFAMEWGIQLEDNKKSERFL